MFVMNDPLVSQLDQLQQIKLLDGRELLNKPIKKLQLAVASSQYACHFKLNWNIVDQYGLQSLAQLVLQLWQRKYSLSEAEHYLMTRLDQSLFCLPGFMETCSYLPTDRLTGEKLSSVEVIITWWKTQFRACAHIEALPACSQILLPAVLNIYPIICTATSSVQAISVFLLLPV